MDIFDMLFGGSETSSTNTGSNIGANQNASISSNLGLNLNSAQGGSSSVSNAGSSNVSSSAGQSTSMGNSSSSGGASGSSQSSQDVWSGQSPFLQQVYQSAAAGNADAQAAIQNLTPGIQNQIGDLSQSGMNAYNQQLAGGNAANLGPSQVAGMQGGGLQQQMLNEYNGQNPYMAGMKDQIADDAQRLKQQNLGSLDARAAAAGMSGSSGYRNQVGDMMESVDDQALNAMTNLGYQSNNQAIQDRIRLSGAADQYNMQAAGAGDQYAMQQAGMMDQNVSSGLGQTNALQQSAMNQYNPAMMGQQAAAMFGQTIGGPTVLGNSSSSNSSFNNSNSVNNSQSTNNSMGRGNSFSNSVSDSFNNSMGVGVNMGGAMGFGNGYNSGFNNGVSNGSSTNGAIPAIAAGYSAFNPATAALPR